MRVLRPPGLDRMLVLLPPLRLSEKLSARTLRTHLFTLITLWVSFWVLIASNMYLSMSSQAVGKRRESLASMCDDRARVLQDQFNVSMNRIQALALLISTFHHSKTPSAIDQKTFATYMERTAFERPLTSGVAYGVKVMHAEREQFERQQGWSIKKMYSSNTKNQSQGPGNAVDAEMQEPAEEYAPVIFAQDAYKHVISFDLLSGAADRDNVLRAREAGKGVLTAPFKLLNNRLGVISTYAVYKYELPQNARPQERIQAVIGYLGGIFDIEKLVDMSLHQLTGTPSIVVNVYDTSNEKPISMYRSNDTGSGMCQVSTLNFGDPSRKHEMHCRFIQSPPWPWMAITTSIGTLVIALLTGYIIYATAKRIARVKDDFREMSVLKKRAEDADIAKSQFLTTVSHEVRTPMNGVLGMLQMPIDTDLDTTQQDYVRTVQIHSLCDLHGSRLAPQVMPLELLRDITNNFSEKQRLGSGTFGTVYKGELDGKEVAVKLLHSMSQRLEYEKDFMKEFENLRRLNHPNIVQLLGYCYETKRVGIKLAGKYVLADDNYRALCFDYMHNGSLQGHLDDESRGLDWQRRYKIIKGVCEGLKYLHKGLENPMFHLDIKPGNILLDENMMPKLADFGLSKLVCDNQTQATSNFLGTMRYCPPEHFKGFLFSNKFDIFSLGVIMIEIVAGSKGYDKTAEMTSQEFIDHTQENWIKRIHKATADCTSPKCECYQVKRCIEIALECVHRDRMQRPDIEDIISRLNETKNNIEKSATTSSSQNKK